MRCSSGIQYELSASMKLYLFDDCLPYVVGERGDAFDSFDGYVDLFVSCMVFSNDVAEGFQSIPKR